MNSGHSKADIIMSADVKIDNRVGTDDMPLKDSQNDGNNLKSPSKGQENEMSSSLRQDFNSNQSPNGRKEKGAQVASSLHDNPGALNDA